VDVDQHPRREARQHVEDQAVDIGAGHRDVTRIDEQDVGRPQFGERRGIGIAEQRRRVANAEAVEGRAGRGVDAGDLCLKPAVSNCAGEKTRRMAGPDLDDSLRAPGPHQGVGGGRVEPREPVLVESRRAAARHDRVESVPEARDVGDHCGEALLGGRKQGSQRRVVERLAEAAYRYG
jgi:hypothetical protein